MGSESAKLLTIKHFLRLNTHDYLHKTTYTRCENGFGWILYHFSAFSVFALSHTPLSIRGVFSLQSYGTSENRCQLLRLSFLVAQLPFQFASNQRRKKVELCISFGRDFIPIHEHLEWFTSAFVLRVFEFVVSKSDDVGFGILGFVLRWWPK